MVAIKKYIKSKQDFRLNENGLLSLNSNREEDLHRLKEEMVEYDIVCLQDVRIKKDELRDVRRNLVGRFCIHDGGIKKV